MSEYPVIDDKKCNGCATCVDIMPEMFAISEDNAVYATDFFINEEKLPDFYRTFQARIEAAIEDCPMEAISLSEEPPGSRKKRKKKSYG